MRRSACSYGRSGLGKTSLLQASLFPALRARQFLPIYVRLDLRYDAPGIADQLREGVREAVNEAAPDASLPAGSESVWEYLHRTDVELWSSRNYLLTPIIVIDQFEELFTVGQQVPTLCGTSGTTSVISPRIAFRTSSCLASRPARVRRTELALRSRAYKLLISLREDFLPDLEDWQQLIPALGRARLRLLPMDTNAALEAVQKPADNLITRSQAEQVVRFVAGENIAPMSTASDGDDACRGILPRCTWSPHC